MKIIPIALAVALMVAFRAHANIQQQVNVMYSGMINVSSPGAYETATRGVNTGGSVVLRNRISTGNLISITRPSAKGGCGRINLYSGSFSYINGEEFVALMRNVAWNAAGIVSGLAFELALDAMEAQTGRVMRNLANEIQALNQMLSNSSQLASGLVTIAKKAYEECTDFISAMSAFGSNVSSDFLTAKSTNEDSPANRIGASGMAVQCEYTGNVLWCAMMKSGLQSQILFGSDVNAEFIMSMVGSYYVSLTNDASAGKYFAAHPMPKQITGEGLNIHVEGSANLDVMVYQCDQDDADCSDPYIRTLSSFEGLETRILEDLQNNGILERLANGTATAADGIRIAYLASSRVGVKLMKITQMAGAQSGYEYLNQFAKQIAADASMSLIYQLLRHTEKGLTSLNMPDAGEVIEDLRATNGELMDVYRSYIEEAMQGKDADGQAEKMLQMGPVFDNGTLPQGTINDNAGA
ncbi:conjugal transfer protein TraH [Pseudomonas aeruginosa]|uniref:conjugal transfer protein TraH n=1 Tax=Pseudomonas aeruginosa TaxID=287 RepID=UPI001E386376|nr:conjugal transfer protein TraH [Pseudomonas aeruginosa]MCC9289583.1 conjugal transfer protein TraH [Pseudomonas aeruginosa]UVN18832.1 F-type type IV secretion, pilus extension and retraction protein [Pseudomonas aeruginosa]